MICTPRTKPEVGSCGLVPYSVCVCIIRAWWSVAQWRRPDTIITPHVIYTFCWRERERRENEEQKRLDDDNATTRHSTSGRLTEYTRERRMVKETKKIYSRSIVERYVSFKERKYTRHESRRARGGRGLYSWKKRASQRLSLQRE